jgi:hypothetical protein
MLRRIDVATLGVSREKHHRYLLGDPKMEGVFLEDGGERIGYAYVAATGHIGPLAVMQAHAMPGAFSAALAIAVVGHAKQISVFVPGTSEALEIAASQGMRFALPMVLLSPLIPRHLYNFPYLLWCKSYRPTLCGGFPAPSFVFCQCLTLIRPHNQACFMGERGLPLTPTRPLPARRRGNGTRFPHLDFPWPCPGGLFIRFVLYQNQRMPFL